MLIYKFLVVIHSHTQWKTKALDKTYKFYCYDFAHLSIYVYATIPLMTH